jgi:nitrite reductase/ring-hydroxylating ferredoxin subunit
MVDFVKVAETTDIPEGKMKMVTVSGQEVLISNIKGNFYAIGNRCTHRGGRLSEGYLEDYVVKCPLHGSKFDVRTGKLISGPKMLFIRLSIKPEPTFEVKIEGTNVMVRAN